MTEHTLTDEMCEVIATEKQWADNIGVVLFRHSDMRAAADWQLEQVIEWIKECPDCYDLDFHSESRRMIADLKQAMRPQQQHQQLENN
jgi:hypothetical protein